MLLLKKKEARYMFPSCNESFLINYSKYKWEVTLFLIYHVLKLQLHFVSSQFNSPQVFKNICEIFMLFTRNDEIFVPGTTKKSTPSYYILLVTVIYCAGYLDIYV